MVQGIRHEDDDDEEITIEDIQDVVVASHLQTSATAAATDDVTTTDLDADEISTGIADFFSRDAPSRAYVDRRVRSCVDGMIVTGRRRRVTDSLRIALPELPSTMIPVFRSNRKPTFAKDSDMFLAVASDLASNNVANRQEKMYALTFMHNRVSVADTPSVRVASVDTDAIAYVPDTKECRTERILAGDDVYEGDHVELFGLMSGANSSYRTFDLSKYFECIEQQLNAGDVVTVADARGVARVGMVVRKVVRLGREGSGAVSEIEFENGRTLRPQSLKAFIAYPAATTTASSPAGNNDDAKNKTKKKKRKNKGSKLRVVGGGRGGDVDVGLFSRHAFHRGGWMVVGATAEQASKLLPTSLESFLLDRRHRWIRDDCDVKRRIVDAAAASTALKSSGGGGRISSASRTFTLPDSTSRHRSASTALMTSEWDDVVRKVAGIPLKDKDDPGKKFPLVYAKFDDGSKIAFDGSSILPVEHASVFDAKLYTGGVLGGLWDALRTISDERKTSSTATFLYLSYPDAARIEYDPSASDGQFFRILSEVKSVASASHRLPTLPPPPQHATTTTLLSKTRPPPHRREDASSITNSTTSTTSSSPPEEAQDDDEYVADVDEPERVRDPLAVYRSVGNDDDDDNEKVDLVQVPHFAFEPISFYMISCGYTFKQINHVLSTSALFDVVDNLMSDDVRAVERAIAEARLLNLRKLVQQYIRSSDLPFPTAWGKDNRTAIRAIETIVQVDVKYGAMLLRANRATARDACATYAACYAANLCAEVLGLIHVMPKLSNVRLPACVRTYTDTVSFFKCALEKCFDASVAVPAFNDWFSKLATLRPSLALKIEQRLERVEEIRAVGSINDNVVIDPQRRNETPSEAIERSTVLAVRQVLLDDDAPEETRRRDEQEEESSFEELLWAVPDNAQFRRDPSSSSSSSSDDDGDSEDEGEEEANVDKAEESDDDDDGGTSTTQPHRALCMALAQRIPDLTRLSRMSIEQLMDELKERFDDRMDPFFDTDNSKATLAYCRRFIRSSMVKRREIDPTSNAFHREQKSKIDQLTLHDIGKSRANSASIDEELPDWTNTFVTTVSSFLTVGETLENHLERFKLSIVVLYVILTSIPSDRLIDLFLSQKGTVSMEALAQTVEDLFENQRETNRIGKLKELDRISNEDRRIAMLLRDTLGSKASEFDKYVAMLPDDDGGGDAMAAFGQDERLVVVDVAEEEDEESMHTYVDVGENPDDDVDEDNY